MRLIRFLLALVVPVGLLSVGCTTTPDTPQVDSSGMVRISTKEPGDLYAHPARSMDDYDNFLLGDVNVAYSPAQQPLSELDTQRLRMSTYEIVTTQIPAAGQLGVSQPGPCTVKLEVQLSNLEFAKKGGRGNGSTTVTLLFRDSLSGDPLVRYAQHRELALGSSGVEGPDLPRLQSTLELVAVDMREHFRYALPLKGTGARADRGCKGTIGAVRKAARESHPR
jgi:hypothetical protein